MALFSPPPPRETLALSFEQTEHGFLYYHYAWSRGIPVTPEEREAYLDSPVFGSRHAWRRSLAGRETAPPRAYWPTLWKLLRTMPSSMAFIVLSVGAMTLLFGLYEPNIVLAVISSAFGCAMLLFGGAIAAARLRKIPR